MDFIIRKDIYGNWWHDFNNNATKVSISDFECVIDEVANTFIIQNKNGSNVPSKAVSIADVKVIDQNISETPIAFSGAVGLQNLLTAKQYPPYRESSIVYDQKIIWRKGHAIVWNETQEFFNANFDSNGLGINLALGWGLCNGNGGRKDFRDRTVVSKGANFATLYNTGGSANAVLIGHKHTFSGSAAGATGGGAMSTGNVDEGAGSFLMTNTGFSENGASVPDQSGEGKNMPPYIIAQWVERVSDLIVYYTGSEGGGAVDSVNGQTGVVIIPLDYLPLAGGTMDAGADIFFDNGSALREGTYDFGGDGGISRICSVDFEDMWQAGIRHVFDNNGLIRHSTNCFDVVPDSSFDNTLRFKVNSLWTLDNGTTYKCTDASTGAAVWEIYNNFIPNLTQVLTVGDIDGIVIGVDDEIISLTSDFRLFYSFFDTNYIGTGGIFLDKTEDFPVNSTIKFQIGYLAIGGGSVILQPMPFTTDADVFYNGELITDLVLNVGDVCELKCFTVSTITSYWILTITNKSSIPNLTQVLTVGDKVFDGVSSDRTWQPADRLKYWQVQSGVQTLDDTVFPDNSLIEGVIQNDDINATVTFDFDGVTPFYLDQAISTVTLNVGDFFQLKHFNGGTWILTVTNKSSGGGGVPYTGATQDVDLGEFGLLTGNIEFDNTPTNIPTAAGSMVWNDTDGTVDLKLKGGNVTLQIGQEQVIRVVNKTATNVNLLEANYQAVRVTGAQGQRLKVDLAQATTDTLSAETIGLVTETINNNQEGFITTSGLIRGINTTGSLQSETWADGDILYLSPTVAGRITKVKPTAPNHLVIIGYVIHAHATQGSIFVKVDNGYELDELHNVKITTAANGQALTYTSATDIWENKTIIQDSITDGVTTVAPSQNAVFDALALKTDKTSWVDYSASSTIVGWSSFTANKFIWYKIIDGIMFVNFYLEGTSNATTATFTLPNVNTMLYMSLSAFIINNGGITTNQVGRITVPNGSSTVTVNRDNVGIAFTPSGSKTIAGQFFIKL
jgi:hypothetical protein